MGLTLNYELRLPAITSRESASAKLRELHAIAATLPFAELSPLVFADGENSSSDSTWLNALRFRASLIATPFGDDVPALTGDPNTAMGFIVNPGEGCETACFGLLRRSDATGAHAEWFWYGFCKTQYASTVSEAHFVACHTSLVHLLDGAVACGIDVVVRDEAQYWETRDDAQLAANVQNMNSIVAAFAGRLSDLLGNEPDDALNVRAPIFDHPRFERLEMGEVEGNRKTEGEGQ